MITSIAVDVKAHAHNIYFIHLSQGIGVNIADEWKFVFSHFIT